MVKPPEGPVVDWMREVLTNIWAALRMLVELLVAGINKIGQKVERLEGTVLVLMLAFALVMVLCAFIVRGKK